ncbi:MAG: hypothetical protein QGI34_21080, partial [Candidatus Latescibacteria bacterium]|nr:hypothetical protein [Candidatus Latescibacterota bacterium]
MSTTRHDRIILRDLATHVAEIADQPVMTERRDLWTRHNRLERVRPMILVFPEGAWRELLPQDVLVCEEERARAMEWELRRRIYYDEHLYDDTVIEKEWIVNKVVTNTGWGLATSQIETSHDTGAWG